MSGQLYRDTVRPDGVDWNTEHLSRKSERPAKVGTGVGVCGSRYVPAGYPDPTRTRRYGSAGSGLSGMGTTVRRRMSTGIPAYTRFYS